MSATTKSISAEQLAKTVGVNRKTALLFQHKVRIAMQSSGQHPMEGNVEVDEAFIGEQEEGKVGRGSQNKTQIVVALEKQGGKATNAQLTALAINDLKNTYVNLNARIINDMLTDKPILTDEDYRDIRATITLLNNRLKHVLKKK